jgi:hypothetical protein
MTQTNVKIIFYLLIEFVSIIKCYEKTYDNYSVIRVFPKTENQLKFLKIWAQNLTAIERLDIDFWRYPSHTYRNVDLMVSPNIKTQIMRLFQTQNISPQIMIENVEKY